MMKALAGFALVLSGLWIYAGLHYLRESIGLENLWYFLPHEIGQFAVGFFTPLFLLWLLVGQLSQTAELRRLRHRLRRQRSERDDDGAQGEDSGAQDDAKLSLKAEQAPGGGPSLSALGERGRRARAVKKAARESALRKDAEKQAAEAKAARDSAEANVNKAMTAKARSEVAAAEAPRARDDALRVAGEEKASRAELEKELAAVQAASLEVEKTLADAKAGAPLRQDPVLSTSKRPREAEDLVEAELVDDDEGPSLGLSPPTPPKRSIERPPPSLGPRNFGKASGPTDVSDLQRADEEAATGPEPLPFGIEADQEDPPGRRPPQRGPRLSAVSDEDERDRS